MSVNVAAECRARMLQIQRRATVSAPKRAVQAMSRAGEAEVKALLSARSHPKGTRTPSQPGQPPAKVSGDLMRATRRLPPVPMGPGIFMQFMVNLLVYAAVQEEGATITAKNFPQLGNPEAGFFGPQVTLPKRPFFRPAAEKLASTGIASRVAGDAFAAAISI